MSVAPTTLHAIDSSRVPRQAHPEPRALGVAVLIPCYNEEAAIGQVVRDFRLALPSAKIFVYDNNSTDRTREVAAAAGATVRSEPRQGKGNVVRRMFGDIDADLYVMVDGDGTYDAASAPRLIERLREQGLDMVVGARQTEEKSAYRHGHRFGNALLTGFVAMLFGRQFNDILSGYRVFSRRFVKTFPAISSGFETETELTVHALELRMPVDEVLTPYSSRPEGSASKLNTYRDGWRILRTIIKLFRIERPIEFYSLAGGLMGLLALLLAVPLFITYYQTGLVPRVPTAILSTGLMILASLSLVSGLILDTVTRGRQELRRLTYLACPPPA